MALLTVGGKVLLADGKPVNAPSSSTTTRETWVWNIDPMSVTTRKTFSCNFTANGANYSSISVDSELQGRLKYGSTIAYDQAAPGWDNLLYRKITFLEPPTGDLLTYLQANAVKQPSDVAVQPATTKEITENGTTTITPDVPYDAMSKVDVTVNVPSSGGIVWVDPD